MKYDITNMSKEELSNIPIDQLLKSIGILVTSETEPIPLSYSRMLMRIDGKKLGFFSPLAAYKKFILSKCSSQLKIF